MNCASHNSLELKCLENRIFFIFPDMTAAAIAEKIGTTRQIVQGWKAGKSRPTLEQLYNICSVTKVDWQWLLTGKTQNTEALTFAYMPKLGISDRVIRPELYDHARNTVQTAIWIPDDERWSHIYPSIKASIHVTAVLLFCAADKNAPDPLRVLQPNEKGEFKLQDIYEACEEHQVPQKQVKEVERLVSKMRGDYIPEGFIRTLELDFWHLEQKRVHGALSKFLAGEKADSTYVHDNAPTRQKIIASEFTAKIEDLEERCNSLFTALIMTQKALAKYEPDILGKHNRGIDKSAANA